MVGQPVQGEREVISQQEALRVHARAGIEQRASHYNSINSNIRWT
jgi:hypothetical protein